MAAIDGCMSPPPTAMVSDRSHVPILPVTGTLLALTTVTFVVIILRVVRRKGQVGQYWRYIALGFGSLALFGMVACYVAIGIVNSYEPPLENAKSTIGFLNLIIASIVFKIAILLLIGERHWGNWLAVVFASCYLAFHGANVLTMHIHHPKVDLSHYGSLGNYGNSMATIIPILRTLVNTLFPALAQVENENDNNVNNVDPTNNVPGVAEMNEGNRGDGTTQVNNQQPDNNTEEADHRVLVPPQQINEANLQNKEAQVENNDAETEIKSEPELVVLVEEQGENTREDEMLIPHEEPSLQQSTPPGTLSIGNMKDIIASYIPGSEKKHEHYQQLVDLEMGKMGKEGEGSPSSSE